MNDVDHEPAEPSEGLENTPWWVWAVSVVTVFAMGFYLGRYGGPFSADPHALYAGAEPVEAEAGVPGKATFSTLCAPCHQHNGAGLAGRYPPLAGSERAAAEDPGVPVRIVLNGMSGRYAAQMPSFGPYLDDEEIAAVLSFVRSSFGNRASPVGAALVKKVRGETAGRGVWTADKLRPPQ